jgi:hypothetical protein
MLHRGKFLVFVAMTEWNDKHQLAFSRRDAPELLANKLRPEDRGRAGMPGARCTRSLVCDLVEVESTRVFTAVAPEITRHPRTQWFFSLYVLSPATNFFFCHRRPTD